MSNRMLNKSPELERSDTVEMLEDEVNMKSGSAG